MASSSVRSKALQHGRSLSFPSESSHLTTAQFDENLSRIRSSEARSSSLSSMNDNLNTLQKLYGNIHDSLHLPHIHHMISEECQEQILDGHIRLLDACSSAKDLVSQTKQNMQELLSALRRKDVRGIHGYLTLRKRSKKTIEKSLKNLRISQTKQSILTSENDHELHMLREAESVTLSMLETLLSYMMGKGQSRQSGWSLISKMMQSKKVGPETKVNEFEKADAVLQINQEDDTQAEEYMNHLKKMESSIEVLEEELEYLFRKLIKTRVFLLNILNRWRICDPQFCSLEKIIVRTCT